MLFISANTACQGKTEDVSMPNKYDPQCSFTQGDSLKGMAGLHSSTLQLGPSLMITMVTDNPNLSHTLQTIEPQATMLFHSFILFHSSIVMQQPDHPCKFMLHSHSSQCSTPIPWPNIDYTWK